ncbi:MAG: class I SAM-dependent methyltransferase [Candidatus Kaiserbacteria bacterium]|nr:class I SAM-dependent methyltransferase [Candidatus Kaiserbacteria bacterium]
MTDKRVRSSALQKLNLGCGTDIMEGWVNLDIASLPGVDVVHNIEDLPLPLADNSFDEILCNDILEHVDYPPVLKEMVRILTPGGVIHIRSPHFSSRNNYVDPTHKSRFSVETFHFFVRGMHAWKKRQYYFDFAFSKIASVHIDFEHTSSRFFFYNRLVEYLVNRTPRAQEIYEMTGLCRIFPAHNIQITLVK